MQKPHEGWFDIAESDLGFAKVGMKEKYFSQVCSLSQQVIEKCLKGYLVFKGRHYPRTHKVVELAHLCRAPFLKQFEDEFKMVDEFYIPTRYPDAFPGTLPDGPPGEREAKEAIDCAERVLEEMRKLLSKTNFEKG